MTKVGVLSTSNATAVTTRSLSRYWRMAPHAPATTPSAVPTTDPMTSSRSVTPMRRQSVAPTGWPVTVDPKLPRTAWEAQSA